MNPQGSWVKIRNIWVATTYILCWAQNWGLSLLEGSITPTIMRISQYNGNIHTDSPTIGEVDVIFVWNPEEFGILVLFSQFCKNSENNTTLKPYIFSTCLAITKAMLDRIFTGKNGETSAFPSISSTKKLVVSHFVHLNMLVFTKTWWIFRGLFSWMVKLGLGIFRRDQRNSSRFSFIKLRGILLVGINQDYMCIYVLTCVHV